MKKEDFKKMGFDLNLPTIKEAMDQKGFNINFKNFTPKETEYFIYLENIPNDVFKKTIFNTPEWQNEFLIKIANKWMEKFPNVFEERLFAYALICFGIDSPGKLNVFIVKCLEWYYENNILHENIITPNELSFGIFPFGFYDDYTCRNIIDYCMKPKASIFSEIY